MAVHGIGQAGRRTRLVVGWVAFYSIAPGGCAVCLRRASNAIRAPSATAPPPPLAIRRRTATIATTSTTTASAIASPNLRYVMALVAEAREARAATADPESTSPGSAGPVPPATAASGIASALIARSPRAPKDVAVPKAEDRHPAAGHRIVYIPSLMDREQSRVTSNTRARASASPCSCRGTSRCPRAVALRLRKLQRHRGQQASKEVVGHRLRHRAGVHRPRPQGQSSASVGGGMAAGAAFAHARAADARPRGGRPVFFNHI